MSSSPMMVMPPPRAAHRLSGHGSPERAYVHDQMHRQPTHQYSSPPQQQQQQQQHTFQHQYQYQQPRQYPSHAPLPAPTPPPSHGYTVSSLSHSRSHSRSLSHSSHSPHPHSRSGSIQHTHPFASASPSLIEKLPNELQHMVYSNLEYQELIHLSTMNKYFNTSLKPDELSTADNKAAFVMRAVRDFPQHRPSEKGHEYKPGNFECYICFRVRSPDHYDMLQSQYAWVDPRGFLVTDREPGPADRRISLRRFCIECGVREGLHAPFDCLTTRTGHDLWVCRCRRVWAKPGCLRCPDCRADCPLRPKKKHGM